MPPRLKECQWAFRQAMRNGDAAERALCNERFHALIGVMADNEYLTPSLRRLLIDHTRISMTFYNPRKPALAAERELAADQHDAFIALIEAGEAQAAADLAVAHWELSRARIESFVTPDSITMPLGRAPGATETRGAS
jgi:DNA-binding GntR family transcriptional regulator